MNIDSRMGQRPDLRTSVENQLANITTPEAQKERSLERLFTKLESEFGSVVETSDHFFDAAVSIESLPKLKNASLKLDKVVDLIVESEDLDKGTRVFVENSVMTVIDRYDQFLRSHLPSEIQDLDTGLRETLSIVEGSKMKIMLSALNTSSAN